MKKSLDCLPLVVIFVFIWLGTAGALNADFRGSFPTLCKDPRWARQNFAAWLGAGLLPPFWVISPFVTGFYQYGWTLDWRACSFPANEFR